MDYQIKGQECECGVGFQHIHKEGEGWKSPIPLVEAIEEGLLPDNKTGKEKLLGVSEWKRVGMERGYWEYFEKEVRDKLINELRNN